MKDNKKISEHVYKFSINNLDNINIMNLYYNFQSKQKLFKIQQNFSEKKIIFFNGNEIFYELLLIKKKII